jgi:hypothetical protein
VHRLFGATRALGVRKLNVGKVAAAPGEAIDGDRRVHDRTWTIQSVAQKILVNEYESCSWTVMTGFVFERRI